MLMITPLVLLLALQAPLVLLLVLQAPLLLLLTLQAPLVLLLILQAPLVLLLHDSTSTSSTFTSLKSNARFPLPEILVYSTPT